MSFTIPIPEHYIASDNLLWSQEDLIEYVPCLAAFSITSQEHFLHTSLLLLGDAKRFWIQCKAFDLLDRHIIH